MIRRLKIFACDSIVIDTDIFPGPAFSIMKNKNFNPGFSLDYKFLDQEYQAQYNAEKRVATLSKYFAALAILISCLGLFGLAAFTAERRLKEIGIRKVLGSSVFGIVYLLSSE